MADLSARLAAAEADADDPYVWMALFGDPGIACFDDAVRVFETALAAFPTSVSRLP